MKIDLHSHTRFSDGHLTPEELVTRAHTMQVDVLAITDHDTIAGLERAHAFQSQQRRAMTIINGVEISTQWHGFDIHIVGLNVPRDNADFNRHLSYQAQVRRERAEKIGEKLHKCGFPDCYERAAALAGEGQVTRAHFARVLIRDFGVVSMDAAFKRYLGKGKRASVKAQWPEIQTAIEWIHQANGQAVLAHPVHYDMTTKWLRRLVSEFADWGGDGIEMASATTSAQQQQIITQLAREANLLASVGSDFHFPSRWTELGKALKIDDALTPIWHNWDIIQTV